ncbi:Vi polysaccharide biosynthesis protein vipA/tviB [Rhodonellum psychrophilum GCM71 = DSM 17998]|uniref:Vi polysaccharide biosynthesis protein vipA/tviB n=2 Tax=Rhodonellum TaxID=336827 RepID=U5BTN0_9BACT|nr:MULTISPECIES: nucleotide sugar dehydrogenase [Rhodonellum]ERM83970.1 Vi polysaccharide biosynthesis protein vipA/tviB [Rhodonellum psychrophilum GCM71 = DSM 17998]SDZ05748.1 UDP-N-acetyl-D-galactosamine dehydrogenase [Rhodonellum ikkaensis]
MSAPLISLEKSKIAVIGLGYVGLPLAVEFAKKYHTVGFDIAKKRVAELKNGRDFTLEVEDEDLEKVLVLDLASLNQKGIGLLPTDDFSDIENCNIYIVTVPTPTDKHNRPILTPMLKASETIGKYLKKGDVVIYESTVYPGVTEEECVPVLENVSGLKFNVDFFAGYSPERINPGDKEHTVAKILKVTAGSTPEIADYVDDLYKSVITAGTHKASSIKVAEAAKVIENSQRDINIAFVNELSKIFNLLGIDTKEVLEAAGTKWNFLNFKPGLVGGHCIGVDPFYLAQKAQEMGYHPEIILAGRRLNDSMGKHVATEVIKHMMRKDLKVIDSKVLILGFTFKENCPDVRNTRVIDIYKELRSFDMDVDIYDPWANVQEVKHEYEIDIKSGDDIPDLENYSAIILAVSHNEFTRFDIRKSENQVVFDVKGILEKELVDARL